MFEIKNIIGTTILTVDACNLRSTDLSSTDLRSADLSGADLSGADLSGANLPDGTKVKFSAYFNVPWSNWPITIYTGHMIIGCQRHSMSDWANFSDSDIAKMDTRALTFWQKNKDKLFKIASQLAED